MNPDCPDNRVRQAKLDPELRRALSGFEKADTVLNEAEFGYRYVRKYLDGLDGSARVLEVGSGPCVLMSQLKIDFPELDITGIEPIGPGFDNFEDTLQRLIAKYGLKLIKAGYEKFDDPGPFDLVFLVNVFEHLPDWRHFLGFVRERLAKDGRCVILCPNYGFPYESHFGLPIFFGKKLTHGICRKSIELHEEENGCAGLWDSLNFVKWSEVRRELPACGLDAKFEPGMLRDMIERLDQDEKFARRQRKIAFIARTMLRLGIVRLFEAPSLHRFHPYMFLEISHAQCSTG